MANSTANGSVVDYNTIDCTLATCPISASYWNYRPSLGMNATLCALFAFSLVLGLGQGLWFRTWSFTIAFILGNISEIIGYGARMQAWHDPFTVNPFLMQICCITIAPAFFSAGIYICLSRIVRIFGGDISRIPPRAYTGIFIPCDIVALILQGAGGGISAVAAKRHDRKNLDLGDNIMLAGLAWQVFTLALFMALAAEYAYRVRTTNRMLNPLHEQLRSSLMFRVFLVTLGLSTTCVLIRCIYRVIEMAGGWNGTLQRNETYFFVLEGVMVVVAVLALNLFPPGLGFGKLAWDSSRAKEMASRSGTTLASDIELKGPAVP